MGVFVCEKIGYDRNMIYFITGNAGKLAEAQAIIPEIEGLAVDLPEIQDIDPEAIIKAKLLEAQKHLKKRIILSLKNLQSSRKIRTMNISLNLTMIFCKPIRHFWT